MLYLYPKNDSDMIIEYENEEIKDFILHGNASSRPYSKWKSNKQLRKDLDKVMGILTLSENCSMLNFFKALNYEHLKHNYEGKSSVRLGYKSKFRLIFTEFENGIRINILEISEHYGDK